MGLVKKARTGTGFAVQIIGGIILAGCALTVFIWTLFVLFAAFGPLAIFIALIAFPVTYLGAVFIVWFSTGTFPVIVLILWLASWVGGVLIGVGGSIKGE